MLYFVFACILMAQLKDVIISGGPYGSGTKILVKSRTQKYPISGITLQVDKYIGSAIVDTYV